MLKLSIFALSLLSARASEVKVGNFWRIGCLNYDKLQSQINGQNNTLATCTDETQTDMCYFEACNTRCYGNPYFGIRGPSPTNYDYGETRVCVCLTEDSFDRDIKANTNLPTYSKLTEQGFCYGIGEYDVEIYRGPNCTFNMSIFDTLLQKNNAEHIDYLCTGDTVPVTTPDGNPFNCSVVCPPETSLQGTIPFCEKTNSDYVMNYGTWACLRFSGSYFNVGKQEIDLSIWNPSDPNYWNHTSDVYTIIACALACVNFEYFLTSSETVNLTSPVACWCTNILSGLSIVDSPQSYTQLIPCDDGSNHKPHCTNVFKTIRCAITEDSYKIPIYGESTKCDDSAFVLNGYSCELTCKTSQLSPYSSLELSSPTCKYPNIEHDDQTFCEVSVKDSSQEETLEFFKSVNGMGYSESGKGHCGFVPKDGISVTNIKQCATNCYLSHGLEPGEWCFGFQIENGAEGVKCYLQKTKPVNQNPDNQNEQLFNCEDLEEDPTSTNRTYHIRVFDGESDPVKFTNRCVVAHHDKGELETQDLPLPRSWGKRRLCAEYCSAQDIPYVAVYDVLSKQNNVCDFDTDCTVGVCRGNRCKDEACVCIANFKKFIIRDCYSEGELGAIFLVGPVPVLDGDENAAYITTPTSAVVAAVLSLSAAAALP